MATTMTGYTSIVWLTAFTASVLPSYPASAFSQIVDEAGESASEIREGILAVPLPPLPGETSTGEVVPPIEGETLVPEEQQDVGPVDPAPPIEETPPAGDIPSDSPDDSASDQASETAPSDFENDARPAADDAPDAGQVKAGQAAPHPTSDVSYGEDGLPRAVRDLRRRLMEAARSGEIDNLRPYLQGGANPTVLSFGGTGSDPIAQMKAQSGDEEGYEILAILLEVLEAGYVTIEPDSENAIYVWPYFSQTRLDQLTPPQKVELFELVTAGDYQSMLDFGAYNFYRLGITPDGELAFFVAGD